jgi:tetratricopeptide (TPR) repeat protein
MFNGAIDNLNRLEEFDPSAMLQQVMDRLNRWLQTQDFSPDWKPDPMIEMLPESLLTMPAVKNLGRLSFGPEDGMALQEAIWTRDLSRWAGGKKQDPLSRARQLFDWTVRNIQLESAASAPGGAAGTHLPQTAGEALLFGQGSVMERAWIFILLARQQGLEAAVLAVKESKDKEAEKDRRDAEKRAEKGNDLRAWAVAVRIGQELYLFDPQRGLPIPAPAGIKVDESGQLDIFPATLSQVADNAEVLRQMDVDSARAYPVKASQVKQVVALIEASPTYLSRRMKLIESRLSGKQRVVLSTSPSAQADRWRSCPHVGEVRLWKLPYETVLSETHLDNDEIRQRMLLVLPFQTGHSAELGKARLLYFKGLLSGDEGATHYYQCARPSNVEISAAKLTPLEREVYIRAKQNASYWLGLVSFERGKYAEAIDYFATRTLRAWPDGPWTPAANYNLGRAYEASGQTARAIAQYRQEKTSADEGQLLRAAWLEKHARGR